VIDIKGILYGTTAGGGSGSDCDCGTVFSLNPVSGVETVLHSFGDVADDGWGPAAGLINSNGTLYGTTYSGGMNSAGTVFSLNLKTRKEKVLYSFCTQQNCSDGKFTYGGVIVVNGLLYGTAVEGGDYNGGTVFPLSPRTGVETTLHTFPENGADGSSPRAGLIDVNGTLYGITYFGGTGTCQLTCGTVFSVDPGTGSETVLYSFCSRKNCCDGKFPLSGLIYLNGNLYGTTYAGGTGGCTEYVGCGTVYSLNLKTGEEKVLYSFQGNNVDGMYPQSGVIAVKGNLYGATYSGGADVCDQYPCGTVFSVNLKTRTETVMHSFAGGTDGANPNSVLTSVGDALYGMTLNGGTGCYGDGCGTVFSIRRRVAKAISFAR
jgi:uncharacterized repeat protein (TIGR03803 family)